MLLAVVDDLIFQSKIEAAAAQAGVAMQLVARLDPSQANPSIHLAIVDLNLTQADALGIVRQLRSQAPAVPIIGYCSHVQTELQQQAALAGCTVVMARSAFVQQLPQLLQRFAGS